MGSPEFGSPGAAEFGDAQRAYSERARTVFDKKIASAYEKGNEVSQRRLEKVIDFVTNFGAGHDDEVAAIKDELHARFHEVQYGDISPVILDEIVERARQLTGAEDESIEDEAA